MFPFSSFFFFFQGKKQSPHPHRVGFTCVSALNSLQLSYPSLPNCLFHLRSHLFSEVANPRRIVFFSNERWKPSVKPPTPKRWKPHHDLTCVSWEPRQCHHLPLGHPVCHHVFQDTGNCWFFFFFSMWTQWALLIQKLQPPDQDRPGFSQVLCALPCLHVWRF